MHKRLEKTVRQSHQTSQTEVEHQARLLDQGIRQKLLRQEQTEEDDPIMLDCCLRMSEKQFSGTKKKIVFYWKPR
jgi:hypothetical protein